MNMTFDSLRIAENIKMLRVKFKLTQQEMGDKIGYSERQIRRLETNGTYNLEVINLISLAFNVPAMDILLPKMS